MKNVAKCDTWCELQNPVNHRVFERKLRPRPSGLGHACLGVTPKDTPNPSKGRDVVFGPPFRKARWAKVEAAGIPCRAPARGGRHQVVLGAAPRHVASILALRTHRL